ncbi:hypothetical protein [Pseudarthrobacter sp. SSS035]|uniref:hypothetical protein n=1 Tax=Pseudarthrobacter sp. SSS035 TaxID=2931399 RepID=UPI00200C689A|nr:hypothetical protein [Pseudarthrobacter sp. SSS035]
MQAAAKDVRDDDDRAELFAAVQDLRAATEQEAPRHRRRREEGRQAGAIAAGIGIPAVTAAVSGAVATVTTLALSGAFGRAAKELGVLKPLSLETHEFQDSRHEQTADMSAGAGRVLHH